MVVLVCIIAFCGYKLWDEHKQEADNNEKILKIQQIANKSASKNSFEPNWDELLAINPDVCAYLYYPKMQLSFPVVATNSNSYYLNHDIYKQYNVFGSIFLDKDCSKTFGSQNSIIYGHSIINKNNGMFTPIKNLRDKNTFDSCGKFIVFTPQGNYICEIFSFQYTAIKTQPYRISFTDDSDFESWISKIKSDSLYTNESIKINKSSKIVTLSTCADNGANRYVVHAKMTEVQNIDSSIVN